MRKHIIWSLVAGLFVGGVVAANAGMWSGLPQATSSPSTGNAVTLPLTGNETGAFDTNLSGGRNPQTEIISVDQIKTYVFGNGGSAGATGVTTVEATTAPFAQCGAAYNCAINSTALTTTANSFYSLVVSSTQILSTSTVLGSVMNVSNTSSGTLLKRIDINPLGGSATFHVQNADSGITFNGTIRVKMLVVN